MRNSIIKIFAVSALLVAVFTFPIFGNAADYAKSSQIVTELGILDSVPSETELDEKLVTRIDALNMALRLAGAKVTAVEDSQVIFSDVSENSGYFATVSVAAKLGIVKSSDFVSFSPTTPIATHEFSRMIVRALGYDFKASKYNYSLSGYTRLAMELDVVDDEDLSDDGYVSLGQACNILYDALFVAPTVSYVANNNVETYVDNGSTVLETVFGYQSLEGIYAANEYTSLYGTFSLKDDEFIVSTDDGQNIKLKSKIEFVKYLGYNVEVFYKEVGNTKEVICLIERDNNVFTINGDEFDTFNVKDREIIYTVDVSKDSINKTTLEKRLKLPNYDINFIYNGQFTLDTNAVVDILNNCGPETGMEVDNITLVDNDGDSKYETISVEVYYDFYVDYLNSVDMTITDKWGKSVSIDENTDNCYIFTKDTGQDITGDKIAAGDVLRIYESLSTEKRLYRMELTTSEILGRISSSTQNSDGRTSLEVVIGENTDRQGAFMGSLIGGMDSLTPMRRMNLAMSFESRIDEINPDIYSFYRMFLNQDGEITGYATFYYNTSSGFYSELYQQGGSTFNATNIGVALDVGKKRAFPDDQVKIKLFSKPYEIKQYLERDYETTPDFKIINIKESALFYGKDFVDFSNDWLGFEEAWVGKEYKDLTAEQKTAYDAAKVKYDAEKKLYDNLWTEYEKYGNDGSKYSNESLKYMFGRKFVIYELDYDKKISRISLPCYEIVDGQLSYYSKPGAYYLKSAEGLFNLTTGEMISLPNNTISIAVPDPESPYASDYDLCFYINEGTAMANEGIYKFDFYTFSIDSAVVQFSVRYIDYSEASSKTAGTNGLIVEKTKSESPYGYYVDNYYIMNATTSTVYNQGPKRMYSFYNKTYNVPSSSTEAVNVPKINFPSSLGLLGTSKQFNPRYYYQNVSELTELDLEPGDIAQFYTPSNMSEARGVESFLVANKVYDRSEDKCSDTLSSDFNMMGHYFCDGEIFEITDEVVAFLPRFYRDAEELGYEDGYTPTLRNCTLVPKSNVKVLTCKKGRDNNYEAYWGDYTDLYIAHANGYKVVAQIYMTAANGTTKSSFYVYEE